MASSSPRTSALKPSPAPVTLRSWPLAEGGRALATFVVSAVVVAIVVAMTTERPWLVVLAVALMAAACWQLFVPVVYELDAMGVTITSLGRRRRVPWSSIDRAELLRSGVRFVAEGRSLAPIRGLYVPWGRQHDEVLAMIDYYLPGTTAIA